MTDYQIQPATTEDLVTVRELAHRIWPATFGNILSPAQIGYMLEMMYATTALEKQVAKGCTFVLLKNRRTNTPVGYLSYQVDYLPDTTKVHKIYLLPDTQGLGLGRQLMEEAERAAVAAGQSILRLDVNYLNPALGFYEHYGFVKKERCNTDIGNGYLMEDWIMEKPISRIS